MVLCAMFHAKHTISNHNIYHVWHAQTKSWNKRKRIKVIGRLAFVAPLEGERYYLRLLLAGVVGPCSFDNLLTVNNQRCSTFHEAASSEDLLCEMT